MYVNFFGFSQMKVVVVVGEGGISLMKMVVVVVMVVGEGAGLSFWEVCPLLLKAEFLCTVPEKKPFISARYLSHFFKLLSDLLT